MISYARASQGYTWACDHCPSWGNSLSLPGAVSQGLDHYAAEHPELTAALRMRHATDAAICQIVQQEREH